MNILSIGGSDPSSGAGIQSDIKTFHSLGIYGLTVVTSITSQNTRKFFKAEPVSMSILNSQIDSILSDFRIDAIKLGMMYNSSTIRRIYKKLKKIKCPIIIDPIIKSTTGGLLIRKAALKDYKKLILPLAYIITPNISEAEELSGVKIITKDDLLVCAKKICKMGAKNVVIKGFDGKKGYIVDFVFNGKKYDIISSDKLEKINHGSGCNYSSSLSVAIVKGKNLLDSCKFAKEFSYNSIKNAEKIGKGMSITKPSKKIKLDEKILQKSIVTLKKIENIHSLIPECQTNFVYSKPNPNSIEDILGIAGRIVKTGKEIVMAGSIEYGGSQHVATAVLEISKKFPQIRSALNIKYDKKIISKFKKNGLIVLSYNRKKEPVDKKNKENSSISWGIKHAVKKSNFPPDIIFHEGDLGKEAMIIIFGKTPNEVTKKITSIL